jgi:hypothetical protein
MASFRFASVAHLEAPLGVVAQTLDALRDGLTAAPPEALFQHVTRIAVRHPRARDLPANDFARWAGVALQDWETSERLAFAGPPNISSLDELRAGLIRVLESVPARRRRREAPEEATFHFLRASSIRVPLDLEAEQTSDLVECWSRIDLASVFYHLIETSLLGPEEDRLSAWLRARGASSLADAADDFAASGRSLARLQRDLAARWRRLQIPERFARRIEAPEAARRADAREAAARLAERLRAPSDSERES